MAHGVQWEAEGFRRAQRELDDEEEETFVTQTGLHISEEHPWLGATPDGLVGDDAILEIKTVSSAKNMTIMEAIQAGKISFIKIVQNQLVLVESHAYFAQVQAQLAVTQRSTGYLLVQTEVDYVIFGK